MIVIGFEPLHGPPDPIARRRPHLADVAANVLDGLLVDPVAEDVHRMAAINAFFVDSIAGPQHAARTYRRARGRPPYRTISYALIAPQRRGELGQIAARIFRERYGGLRALRSPDFLLLSRLFGTSSPSQGELLAFLFFDQEFIAALIEAGGATRCAGSSAIRACGAATPVTISRSRRPAPRRGRRTPCASGASSRDGADQPIRSSAARNALLWRPKCASMPRE